MVNLRSILDRFRPAPPPGQPGPLGVPGQSPRTTADELAPIFALIDEIEAEAAEINAAGLRRAKEITDDAAARALRIQADAERDARDARATAMSAVRLDARERIATILADAKREADAIRQRESEALGVRAQRVVDLVRAIGGEPSKPSQGSG